MRIVRTVIGMLLLTIGFPALLVGGALWTAMQHRDAGGAFSGSIERVTTPGHAVVVPDLDALLRHEAPFTRARDTRLRITARTENGPAFVGIAPAAEAATYLAGVPYAQVDQVKLTSGTLPVRVTPVAGSTVPAAQPSWKKQGAGAVDWASSEVRGQRLTLIVMHPDARAALTVDLRVEVRPGWLSSATWGLLLVGAALIALAMATLAWPASPLSPLRPETLADLPPPAAPPAGATVPGDLGHIGASGSPIAPICPRSPSGEGVPQATWPAVAPPPAKPILAWPPHPRSTVTPDPLPAPVPAHSAQPPDSADRPDPTASAGLPDPAGSAGLPDPVAALSDPSGSAGLPGSLGLGAAPAKSARRRKTAAGLPAGDASPANAPAPSALSGRPTAPRRNRRT